MSTATWAANLEISTDAKFRALFSPMSAALTAAGWTLATQTFASGSDWTTVTAPAADTTARVTEVWAMADALQATSPLYMKIEYGRDSTTRPAISITFGTGASSTTILGQLYTTSASWIESPLIANAVDHYASGSTSRFAVALAVHGTGTGSGFYMGFCIERRKDSSGADVGTGFLYNDWRQPATAFFNSQATTASVAAAKIATTVGYCGGSAGNLTFGGDVCVAPVLYCMGPSEIGMNMVAVPSGSYSAGQTFTATLFGQTVTYIALQSAPAPQEPAGQSLMRMAMRYD